MAIMGHHKVNKNRDKHDFYPTEPKFVGALLRQEDFEGSILEPACGEGHISKVLEDNGYEVISRDLIDHGYGISGVDFLADKFICDNVVTNPPYKHGMEFVQHAIEHTNNKIAMLMTLNFAETQSRHQFFIDSPPTTIILISNRMKDSQFPHAWFVWDQHSIQIETKFVWEMAL